MTELEAALGYSFERLQYLETALTHSSYANESGRKSNERLEFLGDSVLSVIISDYIYKHTSDVSEGDLTKLRASLVCEKSLDKVARRVSIDKFILLGRGEDASGGRERPSIVSDAFEAVLAAIYLDGGMEAARDWVLKLMTEDIEDGINGYISHDYKTELQELVQKKPNAIIKYETVMEKGRAHNKIFGVEVAVNGIKVGEGVGKSKKNAEKEAARAALNNCGWYEKI